MAYECRQIFEENSLLTSHKANVTDISLGLRGK